MAREKVEIITCDRCGARHEAPIGTGFANAKKRFKVRFDNREGDFEDLCAKCEKRVSQLVDDLLLTRKPEEKKLLTESEEQAPPLA